MYYPHKKACEFTGIKVSYTREACKYVLDYRMIVYVLVLCHQPITKWDSHHTSARLYDYSLLVLFIVIVLYHCDPTLSTRVQYSDAAWALMRLESSWTRLFVQQPSQACIPLPNVSYYEKLLVQSCKQHRKTFWSRSCFYRRTDSTYLDILPPHD